MPDENSFMSVDELVSDLTAPPPKERTQNAPEPVERQAEQNSDVEETPDTEAEGEPEKVTAEAEEAETTEGEESETEEGDEPELPAIEPPKFWAAEDREAFAKLTREDQERVLKYEGQRNAATAKSLEDSAKQRNALTEELGRVSKYRAALDDFLPKAAQAFQGKWGDGNIDWDAVTDQYGAEQAFKLKNQFEQDTRQMQQLGVAKQEADRIELEQFVKTESEKLPEVAPDLVDPKLGNERKVKLGNFLVSRGFPVDRISAMSAEEASIAYDAMRWRQAQADAAKNLNKPKAPPPAQLRKPVLKPGAAAGSQASTSSRARAASQRFDQELSVDAAVAALTRE